MDKDLEHIAGKLADTISGKGAGLSFEKVMKLFATPGGKRVLAHLLSDGGQKIKQAAFDAKNGNTSGISEIIATISQTEDGREILNEILGNSGK